MNNGSDLDPGGQNLSLHQKVNPSPEATRKCLTALSGSGQLGPDGTIYLIDTHQLAFAGADYSSGKSKVFGSKYGLSSCPNWTYRAS